MSEAAEEQTVEGLAPTRVLLSQHAFQKFAVSVPAGTDPELLDDPALYVHVASKFRQGDELRVVDDNCTYVANLFVTFSDRKGRIRLKLMTVHTLDTVVVDAMDESNYKLSMRGTDKWCVQRLSDAEFIKKGIPTQAEAEDWLLEYLAQ